MLRVASSNSEVPFSSLPLSFVQPGPALQVSGRFRKFSSPGDQGIEDLVVEEGGEVIYVKASGSGGFGNWSWLHRPSASANVKVTDLNVVDVNGDGVDDLSLTLNDNTLELFIGGTSNGLSSAVKQTSPLIVGDITLDACVDLKRLADPERQLRLSSIRRQRRARGSERRRLGRLLRLPQTGSTLGRRQWMSVTPTDSSNASFPPPHPAK